MKYTIPVNNLNNAIRFYNRLSGSRPDIIGYDYAYYSLEDVQVEILEISEKPVVAEKLTYVVTGPDAYEDVFKRVRHFSGYNPGFDCRVAENYFTVKDPDNHVWVVSREQIDAAELHLINGDHQCYLEPSFMNTI